MVRPVDRVVIPVAGIEKDDLLPYRTFSETTLGISDAPIIQRALEEAHLCRFKWVVVVASWGSRASSGNGFVRGEFGALLEQRNEKAEREAVRAAETTETHVVIVRQRYPSTVGRAVLSARHALGNKPFAVILPDDVTPHGAPCMAKMLAVYNQVGGNIVGVEHLYGRPGVGHGTVDVLMNSGRPIKKSHIIESPTVESSAPSRAAIGRYILQPEIMDALSAQSLGANREMRIIDALSGIALSQPVHCIHFRGARIDGLYQLDRTKTERPASLALGESTQPGFLEGARGKHDTDLS